jgi:hypothetical protein
MYVDALWDFMVVTLFSILTLYIVGYSSIRLIGIASGKNLLDSANRILDLNSDGILKFGFFAYLGIVFSLLLMEILVLLKAVNQYVILGVFTVFAIVFLSDLFRKGKNVFKEIKISSILSIIVFVLILGLASFECWKIIGSQVGPIGDALYHTDVIQILMKNQYFELKPGILFGAHSLVAFLTILLQVPIAKSVLVFSSIFSVMIPMGFYCLAVTCIRNRVFGYICAFVGSFFWLDSMNPISWGSIYQPLAFFVTLCVLGFSKKLLFAKRESIYYILLFSFLLFIPIWAIYPIPVLVLSFWLVLLLLFLLVRDRTNGITLELKNCLKQISITVIAALFSIFSCILFIYNQFTPVIGEGGSYIAAVSSNPKIVFAGMNAFEYNNYLSIPFSIISSFQNYTDRLWGFYTERPGSFDIIPYGVIAAVFVLLLIIVRRDFSKKHDFLAETSKVALLFYAMAVMFFIYINYLDSYLFWLFPSVRVMEFEGIILVMLTGLGIALFWGIFKSAFLPSFDFSKLTPEHLNRRYFAKLRTIENPRRKICVLVGLILALLVFSNLISVQAPLDSNTTVVARNAAGNQILTKDDVALQQWIDANISKNSTILFSPIDGGFNLMYLINGPQFVGSYGDWPVIQFSSQYLLVHNQSQTNEYFASYLQLLTYLSQTPDSSEALSLLSFFNVTYIYVGAYQNLKVNTSLAVRVKEVGIENFTFSGLSAQLLNDSIHYDFIKGVGNASLFKVDYDAVILKTWEDVTFANGWMCGWTAGKNVAYSWRNDGAIGSLTVGGGYVEDRCWFGKTITSINLSNSDYLITSVRGTSNAKFLVAGIDANGTVLTGSANWENVPDNQTSRTYRASQGIVTRILVGALSSDGKNATVYFDFVAVGRKSG